MVKEGVRKIAVLRSFGCYHACMNVMRVIPSLMLLLILSFPVLAADDVPPPPQADSSSAVTADQPDVLEKAPNMQDELQAPDGDTAVDIRSYQRKDGATITEYGTRGRVFKIKVQPTGDMPAYYLYPDASGQFVRRLPGGAKGITPPSWILKEF